MGKGLSAGHNIVKHAKIPAAAVESEGKDVTVDQVQTVGRTPESLGAAARECDRQSAHGAELDVRLTADVDELVQESFGLRRRRADTDPVPFVVAGRLCVEVPEPTGALVDDE